jgi:GNAT superfamily N-acetyltransferase
VSGKKRFNFDDIEVYSIAKALQESINLSDFRCENPIFADYLRTTAIEDDRNNVAKVWLFVTHDKQVVGYVTLIMSQLARTYHPKLSRSTSHRFVPGILISEMATHMDYSGMGLGRLMIEWVTSVAFDLARYVACRLIIVESEPDKIEVYRHLGFEPIEDFEEKRYTMFLEIPLYSEIL